MANLLKDSRSPYWQLQYKDQKTGRWLKKSTGLRHDDKDDTAKARIVKEEFDCREAKAGAAQTIRDGWDWWAPAALDRHARSDSTKTRYRSIWRWLGMFLEHERLHSPRLIRYRHAQQYINWRTGLEKKSQKRAGKNTALLELRVLSTLMNEAVRLELADSNPLMRLGIPREPYKEKREFTDEELILIQEKLRDEPEWMQVCFAIAANTGCRLKETRLPIKRLDFTRGVIFFPHPKGGAHRAFSIPMPDDLRPLLQRLADEGRAYTLDFPFQPSRRWQQFFHKIGLKDVSFHCTRVTYINQLYRAGVPREAAMQMVNHASEQVHQTYRRHHIENVAQYANAVRLPPVPLSPPDGGASRQSR